MMALINSSWDALHSVSVAFLSIVEVMSVLTNGSVSLIFYFVKLEELKKIFLGRSVNCGVFRLKSR
jgi:hypothetical protein